MSAPYEFGELITARLAEMKMSRTALAEKLGVSQVAVHNWIVGKNSCGNRLYALADLLFPNTGRWNRAKVSFINTHNRSYGIPEIKIPDYPNSWATTRAGAHFAEREISMMVLDHCPTGYTYEEFQSELVQWVEPELPINWSNRMSAALAEAEAERTTGRINDNPIVALREVHPRREGAGEPQGFAMKFSKMSYLPKRASTIFYHKYLSHTERQPLLDGIAEWRLHPLLSRCLNTQIAVITSDVKFIFSRRAANIVNGGKIACGVAETMEDRDIISSDGSTRPDVFRAALRGLAQELGIRFDGFRVDPHRIIKFLSLSFDMDYYEPQFIGIADFRKAAGPLLERTRAEAIRHGIVNGEAPDRWENKEIVFVDFELGPVFSFIAKNKITNYGLLCVIQAFQFAGYEFREIEAAFQDATDV